MAEYKSKAYNGWAGEIRDIRGTYFYDNGFAKTKPGDKCALCGVPAGSGVSLSYHAEEYGPTWEEYVAGCKQLCPRCHGMIHMRFRFPNLWKRYKHKVREPNYGYCKQFPNLGAFFSFCKLVKDITPEENPYGDTKTGIPWVDAYPAEPYNGPPKIATRILNSGAEVPDPLIYKQGWLFLEGVIIRNGVTTPVSFM